MIFFRQLLSVIAWLFISVSVGVGQTLPVSAEVVRSEFIFTQADFPSCHASTLVATDSGLVAAWFGGLYERHPEVCIYLSRDSAGHWTAPVKVADGIQSDGTRFPCWNPVLCQTDGQLVLFYKVGPSPQQWWGMYKVSKDNARSWSVAHVLPKGFLGPVRCKPIILSDNEILYGASVERSDCEWNVHLEKSDAQLKHWRKIKIDNDTMIAIQPTLLKYADGRLQLLCRTKNRCVAESWSKDDGKSWSALINSGFANNNSGIDAVTLSNGLQLLVCNPIAEVDYSKGRNRLALFGSFDGEHWQQLLLLEDEPNGEFSYPAIIVDAVGNVQVTYTYNREKIKHIEIKVR